MSLESHELDDSSLVLPKQGQLQRWKTDSTPIFENLKPVEKSKNNSIIMNIFKSCIDFYQSIDIIFEDVFGLRFSNISLDISIYICSCPCPKIRRSGAL